MSYSQLKTKDDILNYINKKKTEAQKASQGTKKAPSAKPSNQAEKNGTAKPSGTFVPLSDKKSSTPVVNTTYSQLKSKEDILNYIDSKKAAANQAAKASIAEAAARKQKLYDPHQNGLVGTTGKPSVLKAVTGMFDKEVGYEDKFKKGDYLGGTLSLAGETIQLPQSAYLNALNNVDSLLRGKGLAGWQRKMDFGDYEKAVSERGNFKPISERLGGTAGEVYKMGMDIATDPLNLLDAGAGIMAKGAKAVGSARYAELLKAGKLPEQTSAVLKGTKKVDNTNIAQIAEELSAQPQETREEILQAIKEQGYMSDEQHRQLAELANQKRGKVLPRGGVVNQPSNEVMATKYGLPRGKSRNVTTRQLARQGEVSYEDVSGTNKEALDNLIDKTAEYIENYKGKGVQQGGAYGGGINTPAGGQGLVYDADDTVKRYGRVSLNDKWYQDFYEKYGRAPNKAEARELAKELVMDGVNNPSYSEFVSEDMAKAIKAGAPSKQTFYAGEGNFLYDAEVKKLPSTKSPKGVDAPYINKNIGSALTDQEIARRRELLLNGKPDPEKSIVSIKPDHTQEQMRTIHEYKSSVDEDVFNFVKKVQRLQDKNVASKLNLPLGSVSDRSAKDVSRITGVDTTGFTHNMNGSAVNHIETRHGANGTANKSMENAEDVARIKYVLDNYDSIELATKTDGTPETFLSFRNRNSSPSKGVKFSKKIDGTYYVVEAVPDSGAKKLQIVSAYIEKERAPRALNMANAPQLTSETLNAPTLSMTSVAENADAVNRKLPPKKDLGADTNRILDNQGNVKAYGTFDESEVPKATAFGDTSKAADTVFKAMDEGGQKTVLEATDEGSLAKFTQTNEVSVSRANEKIDTLGYEGACTEFFKKAGEGKADAETIALGARLMQEARKAGDNEKLYQLVSEYTDICSKTGRTMQAMQILKRLTPEGRLAHIQRTAKKVAASSSKKVDIKLSDETLEKVSKAATEKEIAEANAAAAKEIWDQVPATLGEKINAFRYTAMLANPKTHARNVIGNALFVPIRGTKNIIAGGIERAAGLNEKTRALITVRDKEIKNFAAEAWEQKGKAVYTGETRFSDNYRPIDAKVFKIKPLEKVRKISGSTLDAEDRFFGKRAYESAFAQYMKANKLTPEAVRKDSALFEKVHGHAVKEAQISTFRDYNSASAFLSKLKNQGYRSNNKAAKVGAVALDAVIPFAKTPVNILRRGVEYSPLRFLGTASDIKKLKNGEITANQLIDGIASGITGTGIMGLGAYLYNEGIVTRDMGYDKKGNYESMTGNQGWSLNIPSSGDYEGGTYTIDWAVPSAMPLLVGVEIAAAAEDGMKLSEILEAFDKISNPMYETTMLQGLNDIMSGNYGENGFTSAAQQIASNYISQFVPTLLGQIARTADGTRRSYTSTAEGAAERQLEKSLNKLKGKVPGLSSTLEPYVDAWGREEKTGGAFEQFLSPGYHKEKNVTEVDKEIQRLAKAMPGENGIYPQAPQKYTYSWSGEEYRLSESDLTQLKKTAGKYKYDALGELFKSDEYKEMSDEDKAKEIEKIYKEGNTAAKEEFLYNKTGDSTAKLSTLSDKRREEFKKLEGYGITAEDYKKGYIAANEAKGGGVGQALSVLEATGDKRLMPQYDITEESAKKALKVSNAKISYMEYFEAKEAANTDKNDYVTTKEAKRYLNQSNFTRAQKAALYEAWTGAKPKNNPYR